MGNVIAIKLHTNHGEEVICDARAHVLDWELSMMAWFAGCLARPIASPDGILSWKEVSAALRPKGPHNAPTTLIALENTHNMSGGMVYPLQNIDEICHEAHALGLKVHIDGARIFNAATAGGNTVARIARDADSVMFCLSKGLGAPVGSLLVGTREAMDRARLYRKRLGGGMRQAGVLAAAGLIALGKSPAQQLAIDHANARFLADRLSTMHPIKIDPHKVRTNIVIFDISALGIDTNEFSRALQEKGILANGINATHIRMVTHLNVSREQCEQAADAVASLALAGSAV
jgi:threonine aldolase